MKKLLILALAITSFSIANAQKGFYYGGLLGIGQSAFNSSSLANQTNGLMLGGGIAGTYHFNKYFGIMANGILVSKGTRANGTKPAGGIFSTPQDYEETYRLIYAEIPVMAKLRYGSKGFYGKIFGGPSFNFNLSGTYDIDYKNSNNNDISGQKINSLKIMETALVYGAGIEVETEGSGLYSLEIRMSQGLTGVGRTTTGDKDIINQYFSICIGWTTN